MTYVGRVARVAAMTIGALALSSGVAAASSGNRPSVNGTVTSVDGNSAPGACGTSDNVGTFVVTRTTTTIPPVQIVTTVTSTPTTAFTEHGVAAPTLADVCVGDTTTVIGNNVSSSMTALAVAIKVPKPTHLFGFISSVNGNTTQGACGVAGAAGGFELNTLVNGTPTDTTILVDGQTAFSQKKTTGVTFGNVCVGLQAEAAGPQVNGVVVADSVTVRIPKSIKVKGSVVSVNGDFTLGACGVADTAGGFTVETVSHGVTLDQPVAVTTSTTYAEAKVPVASFADVCVGGRAVAIGNTVGGTLTADAVAAYAPKG
jgi:hypothetical protein